MKQSSLLAILVLFSVVPAEAQSAGRVELRSFTSASLGIEKAYNIYLPAGYDESAVRYPVVYFFRGVEREWFNPTEDGSRNGETLETIANDLYASGLIGPMILVGPNNASSDNLFPGLGVNMLRPDLATSPGIGTGRFEDYIINDLIPHIDSTFRTIPDRAHRGIEGFSYGGFTVGNLSTRHPDMFITAGAYDATLMWYDFDDLTNPGPADDFWLFPNSFTDPLFDNPRNVPTMITYGAANNIRGADSTTLALLREMHFFIQCTSSDNVGNMSRNVQWVDVLGEKGITNGFDNVVLSPNAIHNWFYADLHAAASLQKQWQVFANSRMFARTYVDFHSLEPGETDTMTVSVRNISPGAVTVTGIELKSGQMGFSLTDVPFFPQLLAQESDSITVRVAFSPAGIGEFLDTLIVMNDDSTGNLLVSPLHGTGVTIARAAVGPLYALGATTTGEALYTLDSTSGSATLHSDVMVRNFVDAAIRGVDTTLYGIIPFSSSTDLYRIGVSGNAVRTSTIPVGNLRALAFSAGDTLYAASSTGALYRVDRVTGAASLLGTMPGLEYSGLAFDPLSGILWASTLHPLDSIFTMNTSNGAATFVGTTGFNALTASLTFTPSGVLYGLIDNGTGEDYLAVISKADGSAALLGPTVAANLAAIATAPLQTGPVSVASSGAVPLSYRLAQNYPNPFNPSTVIEYTVGVVSGQQSVASLVRLSVYDILGREVATLVNERREPGTYRVRFDASNLSSGIYIYRLEAGGFSASRRMLLVK